ncbi:tyrosine-type recombinase/integrase [Brachybacterium muris]|uniref:tyrosine-type recombinase/integrase n=1 Tax=Brachybacterium muris TaxID=219301 RepID=UPI003B8A6171
MRVGELINEALPGTWSAHTLRHRFATEAYRGSRDLLLVQTLMGHSKPETTAIYVGLDTAQARSVVDGISLVA